jgi:hypothetical protein
LSENKDDEKREMMSDRFRIGLVLFFSALIVGSIFVLVFVWNPVQNSLTAIKSEERIINGTDGDQTIISITKNSSSGSEKRNVTSIMVTDNKTMMRSENITVKPLSGQAFGTDPEIVFTNPEIRLVIFATFFGVIGASVHGIGSLTAWMSTGKLEAGWGIWYLTRPPMGAALAIITYLILRAGFVSGGPTAISDFGVAALSALVGLMTDEMSTKLRDIFDTLFGIAKPPEEKGEDPSKKKNKGNIKFNPERPEVKLTQDLVIKAHITRRDGRSQGGKSQNCRYND